MISRKMSRERQIHEYSLALKSTKSLNMTLNVNGKLSEPAILLKTEFEASAFVIVKIFWVLFLSATTLVPPG